MEPIQKLAREIMDGNTERFNKMIPRLGVQLTPDEMELTGKKLLKSVMQKWLNAADALLEMFVVHLPSPKHAQ